MLDEAEYASSTDESDEDYNPANNDSDVPSEIESDGEDEHAGDDSENKPKSRKRKTNAASSKSARKSRKIDKLNVSVVEEREEEPKKENEDDDDNEDALWASFLGKASETAPTTASTATATKTVLSSAPSPKTTVSTQDDDKKSKDERKPEDSSEKKATVTNVFEFAGERVEVQQKIAVDNKPATNSANQQDSKASIGTNRPPPFNKARTSGGLTSILGQIGKKNKLNVLEKTQLDWNSFKNKEGIDEELQTHNKGRGGYLERQDFLQRTDLRQFEIEKSLRQVTRRK